MTNKLQKYLRACTHPLFTTAVVMKRRLANTPFMQYALCNNSICTLQEHSKECPRKLQMESLKNKWSIAQRICTTGAFSKDLRGTDSIANGSSFRWRQLNVRVSSQSALFSTKWRQKKTCGSWHWINFIANVDLALLGPTNLISQTDIMYPIYLDARACAHKSLWTPHT